MKSIYPSLIMATFDMNKLCISSSLFIFSLLMLAATPSLSMSFPSLFGGDAARRLEPIFDSNTGVFGDAEIVDGGSRVRLTRSMASSSGLLIYRKPFKFLESSPRKLTSFTVEFTFSISPHSGDGLALIFVPTDFPSKFSGNSSFGLSRGVRFLGIEFDTSMDGDVGDENANHVGVDVSSLVSARVSNVSTINLVLNSGQKLHSWVDYYASSKLLEIRLGKLGSARPENPLLEYAIDLTEMWKEEDVFLGISSSSGHSRQTSSVYSWRFRVRSVPNWMHSQPVDPRIYSSERSEKKKAQKRSGCPSEILTWLLFATGCGALAALAVLFLWAVVADKESLQQIKYSMCPLDFRYEKINVAVENGSEDVKN